MSTYMYKNFVELRDLENVIKESIPVLEKQGIDPNAFYKAMFLHPEIVKEAWYSAPVDAAKAAGAKWTAGRRSRDSQNTMDFLSKMSPEELKANHLDNPEIMDKLKRDRAHADADSHFSNTYNKLRSDRAAGNATAARQQAIANVQRQLGVGPFAASKPASAAPQTAAPQPAQAQPQAAQPQTQPEQQPQSQGFQGARQPTSLDYKSAAQELNNILPQINQKSPGAAYVIQSMISTLNRNAITARS